MRIVGGRLRGRLLSGPGSDAIRPTSDRLRESIFNILAHAYGEPADGARVLDLFAGTGALGLEALSRGAAFALFVDTSAGAARLIDRNVEALGVRGESRILRQDATKLPPAGRERPVSLVFCDPPYGKGLAVPALAAAARGGWLEPQALLVMEEQAGASQELPGGARLLDRRSWGGTEVTFAQLAE